MEPKGLLPHSQVLATSPYPDSARSSPYPTSHHLNIHLNISLPSTPGSPKWSFPSGFPTKSGSLSLRQGASSGCGWRKGLQYGG